MREKGFRISLIILSLALFFVLAFPPIQEVSLSPILESQIISDNEVSIEEDMDKFLMSSISDSVKLIEGNEEIANLLNGVSFEEQSKAYPGGKLKPNSCRAWAGKLCKGYCDEYCKKNFAPFCGFVCYQSCLGPMEENLKKIPFPRCDPERFYTSAFTDTGNLANE